MWKEKWKLPKGISKEWLRKDRLVILLLSGVLLMVIAIPINPDDSSATDAGEQELTQADREKGVVAADYAAYLEQELEEKLSLIEHAGQVRVMITLKDNGEKIVEKDTESTSEMVEEADSEGGERTSSKSSVKEVSIYEEGSEEEGFPYVTKEKSPEVSGVLVIAQGGDNAVVVRGITEAIQALFDIDTHKIKVIKGN